MDEQYEEPVYYLKDGVYHGSHPDFYNTDDFPWVKDLEANWTVIRDELKEYISQRGEINFVNSYNVPIIKNPQGWSNIYFENFMWTFHKHRKHFPKTVAILEAIPGHILGTISMMKGQTAFLPHYGQTNTNIRCHLGIAIPSGLPDCGIRVGKETKPWEEGKVLMFSDSQQHETWNNTDQERVIFVFDILRKEYDHMRFWVCVRYLAAQSVKYFDKDYKISMRIPFIFYVFHTIFTCIWAIYLPINRRFKFV